MRHKDGEKYNIVDFFMIGFIWTVGLPFALLGLPFVAIGWLICKAREAML